MSPVICRLRKIVRPGAVVVLFAALTGGCDDSSGYRHYNNDFNYTDFPFCVNDFVGLHFGEHAVYRLTEGPVFWNVSMDVVAEDANSLTVEFR